MCEARPVQIEMDLSCHAQTMTGISNWNITAPQYCSWRALALWRQLVCMCVWVVGELERVRCRPESIRVRDKGSSEVPINWQRFQKVWTVAAEAFHRGAAARLTPSNHTVGQLVSLPNGAAGKGIITMADHDEKSLTSKMIQEQKKKTSPGLWQVVIFHQL